MKLMINKHQYKIAAFTLIEILLAVALLSVVTMGALSVGQEFLNKSEMGNATSFITQTIRSAQANARVAKEDSAWGVYIDGNTITLFKGDSYALRDSTIDLPITWSDRLTVSGISEIVFSKYDAVPSTTGTISISGFDLLTEIELNSQGNILY